jgi:hypothetical protein
MSSNHSAHRRNRSRPLGLSRSRKGHNESSPSAAADGCNFRLDAAKPIRPKVLAE